MRTQSKTINLLEVWESASYQVGIDLSFASDWLRGTWSLTKGGGGGRRNESAMKETLNVHI